MSGIQTHPQYFLDSFCGDESLEGKKTLGKEAPLFLTLTLTVIKTIEISMLISSNLLQG